MLSSSSAPASVGMSALHVLTMVSPAIVLTRQTA